MPYPAMLYHSITCCAMLCCAMMCSAMLWYVMLCFAVPCCVFYVKLCYTTVNLQYHTMSPHYRLIGHSTQVRPPLAYCMHTCTNSDNGDISHSPFPPVLHMYMYVYIYIYICTHAYICLTSTLHTYIMAQIIPLSLPT